MRFLLIIVLFLSFTPVLRGAGPEKNGPVKELSIATDSARIRERHFDGERLGAYRTQKAFIYDDSVPSPSLWDRFWRWFWELMGRIFGHRAAAPFMKYLFYAVMTALVVFLVLKLIGADLKIFTRNSAPVNLPYNESEDNIHEIDFAEEIRKAVELGNFRFAIRLLYLSSLKKLSDSGKIIWQPGKTNQDYVREIPDPEEKKQFSRLTHQFEYVWYGEFLINEHKFGQIRLHFEQFNGEVR